MKYYITLLIIIVSIITIFLFDLTQKQHPQFIEKETGRIYKDTIKADNDKRTRVVLKKLKKKIQHINPVNLKNKPIENKNKTFSSKKGHALIINGLSPNDKKAFREIDPLGRNTLKVYISEKTSGKPKEMVGPIVIKSKPNKPIYLRAKDKGLFVNGASEIFVRTDKDGLAQVDFQLGLDSGGYRVLITTAGCGTNQVIFNCSVKKNKISAVSKKINN